MPTTSSSSEILELRAAQAELRTAIAAEDLLLAVALLPRLEIAVRRAMETAEDGSALWAEANGHLQSCLHMVRVHRQDAHDEYSRLFDANCFRAEERAVETWGVHG